jgi:copper chaperone CopZ
MGNFFKIPLISKKLIMRASVHIQNVKSNRCIKAIVHRLSAIKNISDVDVEPIKHIVAFTFHTNHDFETVKHALSRMGYPIIGTENKLTT